MTFYRYQVEIRNSAVGAGNPAYVKFDLAPNGFTIAENAAWIIAYLSVGGDAATGTSIAGMTVQNDGVGTLHPIVFPTAAYAVVRAGNAFLPAMSAYNVAYGTGGLAPAGSSVTVSVYSSLFNRKGYGRHYRPFLRSGALDGAGALDGLYVSGIEEGYNAAFLGVSGTTWVLSRAANPVVVSSTAGQNPVIAVKVSNQVANLHTRRR